MNSNNYQRDILVDIIRKNPFIEYSAGKKPRYDITSSLKSIGFEGCEINYNMSYSKLKRFGVFIKDIISNLNKLLKKNVGIVAIQYPIYVPFNKQITKFLLRSIKSNKKVLIVHDLESLRYKGEIDKEEIRILNSADYIIVHTPNMTSYLNSHEVKVPAVELHLFDYLTESVDNSEVEEGVNTITFAGNLKKSLFLDKLGELSGNLKIYLYGVSPEREWNGNIVYKGKFKPDEIKGISGFWGLVWDGDSIDTCSGELGEYMRYNAPHKVSLYIAAGKPVIVWEKSGIADFVRSHNLGITIGSLDEIENKISALTSKELEVMKESVKKYSEFLRKGMSIQSVIEQIKNK